MKRIYSIDFIKILATVCIMFHHFQIYTHTRYEFGINFVGGAIHFEYLVELFFIISGLLSVKYVQKIYKDKISFSRFFIPKYLRFLGPQALSVLAFAVFDVFYEGLYGEIFFDRHVEIWGVIIACFGFSQGWGLENPKMNGTIWYISVLLICYIILYLITFTSKKLDITPYWLFAFVIFFSFYVKTNGINLLFINQGTVRGLSSYFWGVLLGRYLQNNKLSKHKLYICTLLFITSFFVIANNMWNLASTQVQYLYTYCLWTMLMAIVLSNAVNNIFKNKIWGWLGKISFEMYIWHFPIILLILDIDKLLELNIKYTNRSMLFVFLLVTFIVSIGMYYFIEVPFAKWAMNKLTKNAGNTEKSQEKNG